MDIQRFIRYRALIPRYPQGIRRAEIARRLGVNRSTVTRDLAKLEICGLKITEDTDGLISLIERSNMTVSDYLVCGMGLPAIESPPVPVPENTRCALEGTPITTGYSLWDIIPDAAGEFIEMLHGNLSGYLSENAARAFKGTWNMGSWLIFEDGTGFHPLISREEAEKQDRPCWSDLARLVWRERQGTGVLCILTTDVKKRVWPRARVDVLSDATLVYLHDPEQNCSGVISLNWGEMLQMLDFLESILAKGFNKPTLGRNLLSDIKTAMIVGLQQTIDWEKRLSGMRHQPEYQFAYVISQRKK